jgi:hypothetical protein
MDPYSFWGEDADQLLLVYQKLERGSVLLRLKHINSGVCERVHWGCYWECPIKPKNLMAAFKVKGQGGMTWLEK